MSGYSVRFPDKFLYQNTMMIVDRAYVRSFNKAQLCILPVPPTRSEKGDFEKIFQMVETERSKKLKPGEIIATTVGLDPQNLKSNWTILPTQTDDEQTVDPKLFLRTNLCDALDMADCSQLNNIGIPFTEKGLGFLQEILETVKEYLDINRTGIKRIYWVGATTTDKFWDLFFDVLVGKETQLRSEQAQKVFRFTPIEDPFCQEPVPPIYKIENYTLREAKENEKRFMREPGVKGGLFLTGLHFNFRYNAKRNYTDKFVIATMRPTDTEFTQLVVRRGSCFKVTLTFQRPFEREYDYMHLVMSLGPDPKTTENTLLYLPIWDKEGYRPGAWTAHYCLDSTDRKTADIYVQVPANAHIGRWCLSVETRSQLDTLGGSMEGGDQHKVKRYIHTEPVYILFNPWNLEDVVAGPAECPQWIDEYIFNPWGKMFLGHAGQVEAQPWYYGQFDKNALDFCMYMLDKSDLPYKLRGQPHHVVRGLAESLSQYIKINYDRKYKDGTPPMAWMGSSEVINAIVDSASAVKYGHCHILSGVFTTICRAMGIGSRTMTGYRMMLNNHCEERQCNLVMHWGNHGELMGKLTPANVWVYHTWNEVYLRRPDIARMYNGWQAIDTTKRVAFSNGEEVIAGPCPMLAINQRAPFVRDASLFYGPLCAELTHIKQEDGRAWIAVTPAGNDDDSSCSENLGIAVITKSLGPLNGDFFRMRWKSVTKDYNSSIPSSKTDELGKDRYTKMYRLGELRFHLLEEELALWKKAKIGLYCINEGSYSSEVKIVLTLSTLQYNGQHIKKIDTQNYEAELHPGCGCESSISLTKQEVQDYMIGLDEPIVRLGILVTDMQNGDEQVIMEDFRFLKPAININVPSTIEMNSLFYVVCHFHNPWPDAILEDGQWNIQAPGIRKTRKYAAPTTKISVPMIAMGDTEFTTIISVAYNSKQLRNLFGQKLIRIKVKGRPDLCP